MKVWQKGNKGEQQKLQKGEKNASSVKKPKHLSRNRQKPQRARCMK
jgi:hypothetical protein